MLKSELFEGQWVRFFTTDYKKQFVGFIVKKRESYARVAIPSVQGTRSIPYMNLIDHEDVKMEEHSVDSLIEIALTVRDENWFNELIEMKEVFNQWK